MCPPTHYEVDYVINLWMEGNIHKSSRDRVQEQWQKLYEIIHTRATVDLIEPQPGWPDMVFTANAGLVLGDRVVVGVEGIRTIRKTESQRNTQEFTFMGSGVSSERRVELVVEQIA